MARFSRLWGGLILSILLLGFILKWLRQPEIIGYLLAGIIIGPQGVGFISSPTLVNHMGALGVTLLLFFIGMEVSPKKLVEGWMFNWPLARTILLGFVISLSSTTVVLKLLKDRGELNSPVGSDVLLILLAQDVAVVPMLIILGLLGGSKPSTGTLILQGIGAIFTIGLGGWLVTREKIQIPFFKHLRKDPEMQVFAAMLVCFGLAFITGILQLSTALGAFLGGMLIATAKETEWIQHNLEPFHTLFVAFFFVSVGLMVDLAFIADHWLHRSPFWL